MTNYSNISLIFIHFVMQLLAIEMFLVRQAEKEYQQQHSDGKQEKPYIAYNTAESSKVLKSFVVCMHVMSGQMVMRSHFSNIVAVFPLTAENVLVKTLYSCVIV